MLLFGQMAASRAKETGTSERTLHYKADRFEQEGMVSLFPNERTSTAVSPGRKAAMVSRRSSLSQSCIENHVGQERFLWQEVRTGGGSGCGLRRLRRPWWV
jgi:hypothetical protein